MRASNSVLTCRRALAIAAVLAVVTGTLVGTLMLYVGFQHNPQGEFYDTVTGVIDFTYSAMIFFSWFLPSAAAVGTPLFIVALFVRVKGQQG